MDEHKKDNELSWLGQEDPAPKSVQPKSDLKQSPKPLPTIDESECVAESAIPSEPPRPESSVVAPSKPNVAKLALISGGALMLALVVVVLAWRAIQVPHPVLNIARSHKHSMDTETGGTPLVPSNPSAVNAIQSPSTSSNPPPNAALNPSNPTPIAATQSAPAPTSLPPLPSGLRVGDTYTRPAQGSVTSNEWARIPDWLIGSWHQDSVTYLSATGRRETTMASETFGMGDYEIDHDGHHWIHCGAVGEESASLESTDHFTYGRALYKEVVGSSDSQLDVRQHTVNVDVAKSSGLIASNYQAYLVTSYKPLGGGAISLHQAYNLYDQNGSFKQLDQSDSTATFEEPSPPSDSPQLVASFRTYLTNHGMSNMLP